MFFKYQALFEDFSLGMPVFMEIFFE